MSLFKKQLDRGFVPWFGIGMVGVLLLSLTLHFWGLGRFNTLVFDEVYYVKFANDYLTREPFFDAHPPLGKYAIALSVWIGNRLHFGQDTVNSYAGAFFSTFSYRWLNALTGSLVPLVVAGIAYQLSQRRSFALVAGLLVAMDGLLLVESRYALINIYMVFFGLLGQWLFLIALNHSSPWRWFWLALSGIGLGASVSVKWNGLAFLLGIYLVWGFAWIWQWVNRRRGAEGQRGRGAEGQRGRGAEGQRGRGDHASVLQNLTQLNIFTVLFNLAIIPALIYRLVWIPHLQINTEKGFWELHQQILNFHQSMGDGSKVHPYCSDWYTWPLMLRPMVYLYERARDTTEAVPSLPPLPDGAWKVIYDVHAMGNPLLWWFSAATLLLFLGVLVQHFWVWIKTAGKDTVSPLAYLLPSKEWWIVVYIVLNYAAGFLPWVRVTRCTFIYLYMGTAVFGFLAIAWLCDRWLQSYQPRLRAMGVTTIFLIVLALVFWLPVYLGLPLSAQEFQLRMWFRSWI